MPAEIPADRLLLETDSPDGLPRLSDEWAEALPSLSDELANCNLLAGVNGGSKVGMPALEEAQSSDALHMPDTGVALPCTHLRLHYAVARRCQPGEVIRADAGHFAARLEQHSAAVVDTRSDAGQLRQQ